MADKPTTEKRGKTFIRYVRIEMEYINVFLFDRLRRQEGRQTRQKR